MLSLEHVGRPHGINDGICISILLKASTKELHGAAYKWTTVEGPLEKQLRDTLNNHCAELIFF